MERYNNGYKISSYKGYRGKSYSRKTKTTKSFMNKLLFQIVICIFIVLTIILLKALKLPLSDKIVQEVETALNHELTLDEIVETAKALPNDVINRASDTIPVFGKKSSEKKLKLIMPLKGVIVSSYGEKLNPYNDTKTFQRGIEIKTDGLRIVKTVEDGKVVQTGENDIYGKYIKIQHDENLFSIYGNLYKVYAKENQTIIRGERIAELSEDSPVLHFELWVDDDAVNPLEYFNSSGLI